MIRNVHKCYNKFNGVQIIFVAIVKRNIETIFSPTNITTTSTSQFKLIFSKL